MYSSSIKWNEICHRNFAFVDSCQSTATWRSVLYPSFSNAGLKESKRPRRSHSFSGSSGNSFNAVSYVKYVKIVYCNALCDLTAVLVLLIYKHCWSYRLTVLKIKSSACLLLVCSKEACFCENVFFTFSFFFFFFANFYSSFSELIVYAIF